MCRCSVCTTSDYRNNQMRHSYICFYSLNTNIIESLDSNVLNYIEMAVCLVSSKLSMLEQCSSM